MLTLNMRPYAGETDLRPIVALCHAAEVADGLDERTTLDEVRSDVAAPSFDAARDMRLWEDDAGQMVAIGMTFIRTEGDPIDGGLWYRVHPTARDGDVELQVLAWG